ncbi:hypothetical protein C0J52_21939 [Blattella germanica]|nr:hypothetical protein C0J52_21939 [Blattella germanica]
MYWHISPDFCHALVTLALQTSQKLQSSPYEELQKTSSISPAKSDGVTMSPHNTPYCWDELEVASNKKFPYMDKLDLPDCFVTSRNHHHWIDLHIRNLTV